MTRAQLLVAMVGTIHETTEAPEGILWVAAKTAGYDYSDFQSVIDLMTGSGIATSSNHVLTLTPVGTAFAERLDRELQKRPKRTT